MTTRETSSAPVTVPGRSLGAVETADVEYRAISPWAILAAVLALASPVAWIHPLLWSVPLLAVVVGAAGLAQIKQHAAGLAGQKAAWLGVLMGIACGIGAPLAYNVHYVLAEHEARRIGLLWFEYLRNDEPQKALQLMEHPRKRLPPDDRIWDHLRDDALARERFDKFVRRPLIRALLALDGRATVRFYQGEGSQSGKRLEVFHERFAVTWEGEQQRRTLLVRLDLHRITDRYTGEAAWLVNPTYDISPGPEFESMPPGGGAAPRSGDLSESSAQAGVAPNEQESLGSPTLALARGWLSGDDRETIDSCAVNEPTGTSLIGTPAFRWSAGGHTLRSEE
ncbi:MAG: hypothetical protein K2Y37_15550 [Pirellulales bacterium]|nr:hypothetical protein [Pirellulales bacterium]